MRPLVETALLGHGLQSISNSTIQSQWLKPQVDLAWVEEGQIIIGQIERFLTIRNNSNGWKRFDGQAVSEQRLEGNGYLTASGTMAVGKKLGYDMVVSCGLGGIGDIKEEAFCFDLIAITEYHIPLIATAFKDMIDYTKTFNWLSENGAKVFGYETDKTNGYLFQQDDYQLDGKISLLGNTKLPNLILNPIDWDKRMIDSDELSKGILEGKKAESYGEYYHPAVNSYFDQITNGYSSSLQLESLIDNIEVAYKI